MIILLHLSLLEAVGISYTYFFFWLSRVQFLGQDTILQQFLIAFLVDWDLALLASQSLLLH